MSSFTRHGSTTAFATSFALGLGAASCDRPTDGGEARTFYNPIAPLRSAETPALSLDGLDSADPYVFVWNGRYYLTHTGQSRVVLRSAETLAGLADAPIVEVFRPGGGGAPPELDQSLWAPEFHRLEGPDGPRWYLYVAAHAGNLAQQRQMVLESAGDDPFGPYTFRGILDTNGFAIDATVFTVSDRTYLIYSGHTTSSFTPASLFLGELRNPWTFAAPPIVISSPTEAWERVGLPINEGPEVLMHGALLHVIYSADACTGPTYKLGRLTVAADADLLDPATWTSAKAPQPLFVTSEAAGVFGPGHGSFFRSPDGTEDWQVYHATSAPEFTCLGGMPRTTRAQRIEWNPDGTPDFGEPLALATTLQPPSGEASLIRQAELAPSAQATGGMMDRPVDDRYVAGSAIELRDASLGGALTFDALVPSEDDYVVRVRLAVGPSRGVVRLIIDGEEPPSARADAYRELADAEEFTFGTVHLARGRHAFRFEVVAAGLEGGFDLAVDQVRLR